MNKELLKALLYMFDVQMKLLKYVHELEIRIKTLEEVSDHGEE